MAKLVLAKDLMVGDIIAENIINGDNQFLAKKGTVLTRGLIGRLQNWLSETDLQISIVDGKEESKAPEVSTQIDEELKGNTINSIMEVYNASDSELSEKISTAQAYVKQISEKLSGSVDWFYDDEDENQRTGKIGEHYFRVAKLAITLANIYNQEVPKEKAISLESIAMAALLHDYGKKYKEDESALRRLSKNSSVLNKCGLLSQPYNNEYHTVYAYASLAGKLPETTRVTILLGETKDSYNQEVDQTSPSVQAAKIINLCNVYDVLLENVIGSDTSLPLENVVSYMGQLTQNGTLSESAYQFFLKHVPAYRNGIEVKLSDGKSAIVVDSRPAFRTKPTVLTLPTSEGVPELIDLSKRTNLVIDSVKYKKKKNSPTTEFVYDQIKDTRSDIDLSGIEEQSDTAAQNFSDQRVSFMTRLREKIGGSNTNSLEDQQGKVKGFLRK